MRLGTALDDKTVKIVLDERDIPTHWYNVVPDLPPPLMSICLMACVGIGSLSHSPGSPGKQID